VLVGIRQFGADFNDADVDCYVDCYLCLGKVYLEDNDCMIPMQNQILQSSRTIRK